MLLLLLLLLVCALILSAVACGESNAVASQAGSTVRMRNASGQSDSQEEAGRKPINNYHSPTAVCCCRCRQCGHNQRHRSTWHAVACATWPHELCSSHLSGATGWQGGGKGEATLSS